MGRIVSFPHVSSPFQVSLIFQNIEKELEKEEPMTDSRSKSLYSQLHAIEKYLPQHLSLQDSYATYFNEIDKKNINYLVSQIKEYVKRVDFFLQQQQPRELINSLASTERLVHLLDQRGGLNPEQLKTILYVKNYLNQVVAYLTGHFDKAPVLALEAITPPPEEVEMLLIEELYLLAEDYFFGRLNAAQRKLNILTPSIKEVIQKLSILLNGESFQDQGQIEKIQILLAYAQQLALGEMEPVFLSEAEIKEIFNYSELSEISS